MEIKHNSEEYIELEKQDRDKPDREKNRQQEKRVSGEKGKMERARENIIAMSLKTTLATMQVKS